MRARLPQRDLCDRREPVLGVRQLGRCRAIRLLNLEYGCPAEVATFRTLGSLEVLEAVAARQPARAALEAFDYEGIHARSIGAAPRRRFPSLGDRWDGRVPRKTRPSTAET